MEYKEKDYNYTPEEKRDYWEVSIGLQDTDNLKPSKYLLDLANDNITGKISVEEISLALKEYYKKYPEESVNTEEADYSSLRINEYLQTADFNLHPMQLNSIHSYIFSDRPEFNPGEYRTVNLSKAEPTLNGSSVVYQDFRDISNFMKYDIDIEKQKNYVDMSDLQRIESFESFISGIWKTHPFREGNTRSIAVFSILYLRYLGFNTDNEPFKNHSKYFRAALVRASYSNVLMEVSQNHSFLQKWFDGIMFGNKHSYNIEDLIVPQMFLDINKSEEKKETHR